MFNFNEKKFYQKMNYLKFLIVGLFQNNVLRYYFNTNYLRNKFFYWSYQLSSVNSLLSYHQKALLEDGICRRSTYVYDVVGGEGF